MGLHINTISMGLIAHFVSNGVTGLNCDVFLSLKAILILSNSADSDEMQRYTSFHLALHCLPKYPFRGF